MCWPEVTAAGAASGAGWVSEGSGEFGVLCGCYCAYVCVCTEIYRKKSMAGSQILIACTGGRKGGGGGEGGALNQYGKQKQTR